MGEAKKREEAEAAAREQQEKAQAELERIINTPITQDEAKKQIADFEVNRAQLRIIRQKWATQATQLRLQLAELESRMSAVDERLLSIDMECSVVFRRTLNAPAPSMGEPVGGEVAEATEAPEAK